MYANVDVYPVAMDHYHPAFPVHQAQNVTPELATQLDSGHWVRRLPAADSRTDRPTWELVRPRKVNAIPVGRPYFELLTPKPPATPQLNKDETLKDTLQKGPESLAWYETELARRAQAEQNHEEYTLPALRPTLENMRIFIAHLRAGRQFDEPLTDAERRALDRVDEQAQRLLDLDLPYQRTLGLTLLFGTLYDLLAQKRILQPLAQRHPELTRNREPHLPTLVLFPYASRRPDDHPDDLTLKPVADIDPEQLFSYAWNGLYPDGLDERFHLFAHERLLTDTLYELSAMKSVLVYPTWEPLDIGDFSRLGHLPVYPIAMTTDYAVNADGFMHSPLRFMTHDIFHASLVESYDHLHGPHPLQKPANRLAFRQLMLDSLPDALAPWQLDAPMDMLVFHLLHEEPTREAMDTIEHESFVGLLWALAVARRERWCDYSRPFQGITDRQSAAAALWMHRLFAHWTASGLHLTPEQLDAFAHQFITTDWPELRWHLDYIQQHQTALRDLFLSESRETTDYLLRPDGNYGRFSCRESQYFQRIEDAFFHWMNSHGGCCVDHSDVLYFDRFHKKGGPTQMEQTTGAPIIHRTPR